MLFKRNKIQVVPTSEYTDYSDRFEEFERMREEDRKFATNKTVAIAATVPTTVSIGLAAYNHYISNQNPIQSLYEPTTISEPLNVLANTPFPEPSSLNEVFTPITVNSIPINTIPEQTGVIADASLEALATLFDPFIQILVAISFPVASMVMAVSFFIIMFGMKEKALTLIMNAGIGYVLVQMLPLFNSLLKTIGEAV